MRAEFEADARGFERAAADDKLERIVSEQGQVARAAARRNTRLDRDAAAADAALGQRVEIGRVGRFEFGRPARLHRQTAEAIGNEHDNFGIVFGVQRAGELVHVEIGH